MNTGTVKQYCRVCLRKHKNSNSIYEPFEEGGETPCQMLQQITGLDLEIDNGNASSPQKICKRCVLSLIMAIEFRNRTLKNHKIIERYKKKPHARDSPTVFYIKHEKLDESSCTLEDNENVDDFLEEITEISKESQFYEEYVEESYVSIEIKDESMESFLPDTRESPIFEGTVHLSESQNDEYNTISQTNYSDDFHYEDEHDDQTTLSPEANNISPISINKGEDEINSKENKRRSQRGRKGKPRVSDEDQHICDICGNIYQNRGRMLEHRRRHDRDLAHACEICGMRFNLREKMRKHMLTHDGGKPYKCKYCSRTFYYRSVREAHEAVHMGIRSYVCKICGKSFSYPHTLKKHEMIHNKVKLYHCSYCNKDFRLQHHMKQHEQTRLHQNTVQEATNKMKLQLHKNDDEEDADLPDEIEHVAIEGYLVS